MCEEGGRYTFDTRYNVWKLYARPPKCELIDNYKKDIISVKSCDGFLSETECELECAKGYEGNVRVEVDEGWVVEGGRKRE